MRELNVFEMQEISGGYSWDTSSFMSTLTSLGNEWCRSSRFRNSIRNCSGYVGCFCCRW